MHICQTPLVPWNAPPQHDWRCPCGRVWRDGEHSSYRVWTMIHQPKGEVA